MLERTRARLLIKIRLKNQFMSSQVFHRISYRRVQKIIVWERLKLENLGLFYSVAQEQHQLHMSNKNIGKNHCPQTGHNPRLNLEPTEAQDWPKLSRRAEKFSGGRWLATGNVAFLCAHSNWFDLRGAKQIRAAAGIEAGSWKVFYEKNHDAAAKT
jgi:hypothetical protein